MKLLAASLLILGFWGAGYGAEKHPRSRSRLLLIRPLLPSQSNAAPCRVHRVGLQKGVVPIEYGQPDYGSQAFQLASQKLFPNARSKFIGGCVVQEFTDAVVLFCPQCRRAEAVWKEKNAPPFRKIGPPSR